MSNNNFLKISKKKSGAFAYKIILPIVGLLFVALNPLSIFVISVLLGTLLYLTVFRQTIFRKLLLFIGAMYMVLLFIYSVSPRIQYIEFKTTHPSWVEVEGNFLHVEVRWKGSKTKRSAADITYQYRFNNKLVTKWASNVLRNNTYSIFWSSLKERKESDQKLRNRIEHYIQQKNFKILKSPNSDESKLFIPLDHILFSNSFGVQFLVTVCKIMLIPLFFIVMFFFVNDKRFKRLKN